MILQHTLLLKGARIKRERICGERKPVVTLSPRICISPTRHKLKGHEPGSGTITQPLLRRFFEQTCFLAFKIFPPLIHFCNEKDINIPHWVSCCSTTLPFFSSIPSLQAPLLLIQSQVEETTTKVTPLRCLTS